MPVSASAHPSPTLSPFTGGEVSGRTWPSRFPFAGRAGRLKCRARGATRTRGRQHGRWLNAACRCRLSSRPESRSHPIVRSATKQERSLSFAAMRRATSTLRPEIRQDHPLNLSISISGGKETNQDSPSSGERTGKSPACESPAFSRRVVVLRRVLCDGRRSIPLEKGVGEGENPVGACCGRSTRPIRRVGLFGNAALNGW